MDATQQTSALYLALLGRPADVGGQQFWLARLQAVRAGGVTDAAAMAVIAREMATSPEALASIGATPAQVVDGIYQHLFGHPADAAGAAYWTSALASGLSTASLVASIIDAAPADATMNNRISAAGNFTASLQRPLQQAAALTSTGTAAAKAYLAGVTADPGSLTAATAALPGLVNNLAQALALSEVQSLYVALFHRAADPAGLIYWQAQLANGASMKEVARGFAASPEFTKLYAGLTAAQMIDAFYLNSYGRIADAGGRDFWQQQLTSGAMTASDVAVSVITGASNTDALASANKSLVASSLSQALNTAQQIEAYGTVGGTALAQQYLAGVTADPATVTAALANMKTVVNAMVALSAPALPSSPAAAAAVTDSAANLLANLASIVPGTDITITGALTLAQLATLDNANGNGALVYTAVNGDPASLAANATGYIKAGINVAIDTSALQAVSLAQLAAIDAANGAGTMTYTYVADSVAALLADAGTYVKGTTRVTVSDAGSITQYSTLLGSLNPFSLTINGVADTALNLFTDIGNNGFWVSSGMNVTVTTAGTLAQLSLIDLKNTTGALNYTAVTDTAANLVANTGTYLKAGIAAIVTDSVTLAQLNTIDAANGSALVSYGTVSYEAASTPGTIANFASGTNKFQYKQTVITHGAGTSADGIVASEVGTGATIAAALAANSNGLVYIAQGSITGDRGETQLTALAANFSSGAATALVNKLVLSGALSGTITGLDTAQGAGSTLWVLNTGVDSVVLRVTNADTTVADTLTTAEVQVIGVFAGTGQLAAADFI